MSDILPTHHCFDDAAELLDQLVGQDPSIAHTREFILVHAICEIDGQKFAHAWVERSEKVVIFSGIHEGTLTYFETTIPEFYSEMGVSAELTKYTVSEVALQNRRHIHLGPWEEKYRALCGTGNKIYGAATAILQTNES